MKATERLHVKKASLLNEGRYSQAGRCHYNFIKGQIKASLELKDNKMCPLAPFHVIILYLCLILPLLFAVIEGADELAGLKLPRWNLQFTPDRVDKLKQFNLTEVNITLNCTENCDSIDDPGSLQHLRLVLTNEKENIASLQLKVICSRLLF